jgi:4-carboxymuconolactone decarboxylase
MAIDVKDRRAAALKVAGEMMGPGFVKGMLDRIEAGGVGADVWAAGLDDCFGAIWARPGLDRRARSIATIAALMSLRLAPQLKVHLRAGMANGLTPEELAEVVMHAGAYLGFPTMSFGMGVLQELLAEPALKT